jgi:hypothetical protein
VNRNPAAATAAAKVSASRWRTDRLEDYVYLRCFGLTLTAAAEHMGVARRQAERYESYWRQSDLVWPPREDPARAVPAPVPSPAPGRDPLEADADGARRGCGTYLANRVHELLGEDPCPACAGWLRARYPGIGREDVPDVPERRWLEPLTELEVARNRAWLRELAEDVCPGTWRDLTDCPRDWHGRLVKAA